MISFIAKESFVVKTRGRVFQVRSPVEFPRSLTGFIDTFGKVAVINGTPYEVMGIESWCVTRPIAKDESIGLLVKDKDFVDPKRPPATYYGVNGVVNHFVTGTAESKELQEKLKQFRRPQ